MAARLLLIAVLGLAATPFAASTPAPTPVHRVTKPHRTHTRASAYAILGAQGEACRDAATEPEPCAEAGREEVAPPRRRWAVTPGLVVP